MTTTLGIAATLLALTALSAWILAIRVSYRIERLRTPEAPRRALFTNVVAGLFRSVASTPEEASLRRQLRFRLAIALSSFVALGALSFALPLVATAQPPPFAIPDDGPLDPLPIKPEPPPSGVITNQPLSGENPVGTTLVYTRSNQDGTRPVRILVHIASPTELDIARLSQTCASADVVFATIDPLSHEITRLVQGRLARDGTHAPQTSLSMDTRTRRITVRLGGPEGPVSRVYDAPHPPWRMYDLDLAEFALAGPPPKGSFTFGLALGSSETGAARLTMLGDALAELMVSSWKPGDASWAISDSFTVYTVTGPAFGPDGGGILKLDPRGGHVLSARLDRPSHPSYDDFMLQLNAVHRLDGAIAWRESLSDYSKHCAE